MIIDFYCVRCRERFSSEDWELVKFVRKKRGFAYSAKAIHHCGTPNWRMLKRGVVAKIKDKQRDRQEV